MRWSELPPEQLEIELARLGINFDILDADIQDVPELKAVVDNLTSEGARRRLALEYFGDEGHPQPAERSDWFITGRTPDWGRMPRLEDDSAERIESPRTKKPRHRHPARIPTKTVKQLMLELAQRKARPKDRNLTQEKIAGRAELDRTRVQQAEALQRVGWDLLRSHPEFSASDGFVRWPSAAEAARILASERAEN